MHLFKLIMNSFILIVFLFAQVLCGQPGGSASVLGQPVLGYVLDPAGAGIRPIYGIPGASLAGDAIGLSTTLAFAAAAPDRNYVLGITAQDSRAVILIPHGASFSEQPIAGISPGISQLVLSPAGSAAALLNSSESSVYLLTGLPDAPVVTRRIEASRLSFAPELMAISDDGQWFLAAPAPADGARLILLGPNDQLRELPVPPATAIAFRPRGNDALIVSSTTDHVWIVRGLDTEATYENLPGGGAISSAIDVASSSNGGKFYVANSDGSIAAFDGTGGTPVVTSCHCVPTRLARLQANSAFLLNDGRLPPLRLLDASHTRPQILFIPVDGGVQ